jgi:pimeloyl-ACP methyl ester carboxylesterase
MNSFSLVISLLLVLLTSVASADSYPWSAADVRGDEQAVLVLCPGMNQDGAFFLNESPWMDFARDNDLGVIALSYKSNSDQMYGESREGYYWPEQGSGEALLDAVRSTYGRDLPILIYGFSGGAQFTSRFAEWVPERVIAWAAYSAQFWDSPSTNSVTPPGIVACGELDALRWFPSFAYFYEGRALGKPWTWVTLVETGHHRKGSLEAFVREYFISVLNDESSPGIYLDVDSRLVVFEENVMQPELISWLPNERLIESWRGVHHP